MEFYIDGQPELYNGTLVSERVKLFFPDDLKIVAGGTRKVDLKIVATAGKNVFYVHPSEDITRTPLRFSLPVYIHRGTTEIKVSFDNISKNDYYIKRGDSLVEVCNGTVTDIKVILGAMPAETGPSVSEQVVPTIPEVPVIDVPAVLDVPVVVQEPDVTSVTSLADEPVTADSTTGESEVLPEIIITPPEGVSQKKKRTRKQK